MRTALLSLLFVLGISISASAQTFLVEIADGLFRNSMEPASMPYTTEGSAGTRWQAIPATAPNTTPQAAPFVNEFRIRSWVEGDGVRVLVFAVNTPQPFRPIRLAPDREEQIASVALKVGESFEVTATDKYNAKRVTVNVSRP